MEQPEPPWYCVDCGVRLKPDHEFCWNCGTGRWRPAPPAAASAPAPEPPAAPRPAPGRTDRGSAPGLGSLKFFFGFWGVLLLVWATYATARLVSPTGRSLLIQSLPGTSPDEIVAIDVGVIGAAVLLAGLHAIAFYGIRRYRVGGWLIGVLVAGLWSLVLVGVPALYVLLQRSTREAFGLA